MTHRQRAFVAPRLAAGLLVAMLAPLAPVTTAWAQAAAPDAPLSLGPAEARADREFLSRSLQDGLLEVEMARVVQARATQPATQALAASLAQGQSPVNDELARLAAARGLATPVGLDRNHQDTIERLSKTEGADFDRAYLKQMVDGHRLAITDFERQATQTKDPQIKDLCVRVLPLLRQHLGLSATQQEAAKTAP